MSWLDDLEAAAPRGAIGYAGIHYHAGHECEVCSYHSAKHILDEEKR